MKKKLCLLGILVVSLLAALWLWYSYPREPEIIELKTAHMIYKNNVMHYFIIKNMPEDPQELVHLIAHFNEKNIDMGDMLQKNYEACLLMFYKQTPQTMKAFRETDLNDAWGSITGNGADYGVHWRFKENKIIEVEYGATKYPSWKIENPVGKEVFYPWLRYGAETD